MKTRYVNQYECWVGEDAKDNWNILEKSDENDIFFHLTKFPSCFLILRNPVKVDKETIHQCADLCVRNTKYRNLGNIYVDYTMVKNVQRGEIFGEVYYISLRKVKKVMV